MGEEGFMLKLVMMTPHVKSPWNIICLIMNIVFPGVGTLIAGIMKKNVLNIIFGLCQFFLSWILVGWIWSVIWGFLIYKRGTLPL
jgi:hypothetical protein